MNALVPGKLIGCGVFETMRACRGKVFAFDRHMQRLRLGYKALKIKNPYSDEMMQRSFFELIRKNRIKDARVRFLVWLDMAGVHAAVAVEPYHPYAMMRYQRGFKGMVYRPKDQGIFGLPRIKSIDYMEFAKGQRLAKKKGLDEAILINSKEEIVEGSRTNIFCIHQRVLLTPALYCGCLDGITRQVVMRIAYAMNLNCREERLPLERLCAADEAFVTNSLMGIMPLSFVGRHKIGSGKAGPLTIKMMKQYANMAV